VCTIANFDIYISRAAKESNVVSITDIDLNVKSRGGKLFLICVVCVATLIKYNGRNLGEDLNNDTNSQDTSDQQEASDKQKPIDVEKTKQKLADIDNGDFDI
jgi:hypothetical protein